MGALQRWFGQCLQPGFPCNGLSNRCRKSGELLRSLPNDMESLTRRTYAHMERGVQSELAAFEMAVERELVWGGVTGVSQKESSAAARASVLTPASPQRRRS